MSIPQTGRRACRRHHGRAEVADHDVPAAGGEAQSEEISGGEATGTIEVWAMGTEGEMLGDFVAAFEEENPDAKVKVTAVPWEAAHDKIANAIAAGETPDVSLIGTKNVLSYGGNFRYNNFDLSIAPRGDNRTEAAELHLLHIVPGEAAIRQVGPGGVMDNRQAGPAAGDALALEVGRAFYR